MSREVRDMFARIATRYDLANTVLSLGIHHRWRSACVQFCGAAPGETVLDCATGTGDFAITFKRAVGPRGIVIGTDFCREMLAPAPSKSRKARQLIRFAVGDVLKLPFADNSFDIASIAFGIRNVDAPMDGMREMARVVRPGGRVCILEFGQPGRLLGLPYRFYSRLVMPAVGQIITGDRDAYKYLPKTAEKFPAGVRFVAEMQAAGCFSDISVLPMSGGIAYSYLGIVRR